MAPLYSTKQDEFLKSLVLHNEEATISEMERYLSESRKSIHDISRHLVRRDLIKKKSVKKNSNGKSFWLITYKINPSKRIKVGYLLRNKFGGDK